MCRISKTPSEKKQPLQWYLDRVGKRIKRINGNPKCREKHCVEAQTTGLIVHSKDFAEYLHVMQEHRNYRYGDMGITVLNPA